jgi:PAS domain S-box-containing protein
MSAAAKTSAIRRRLIRAIMITSTTAVALSCAAFSTYAVVSFRQAMIRHHATLAQAIAVNTTAALAFQNRADAQEVLSAFKADPSVHAAALFDGAGAVFARYPQNIALTEVPTAPPPDGIYFRAHAITAVEPVIQGGQIRLGTLYFQADTTELYDRLRVYAVAAGSIIVVSLAMAYLIGRALQQRISDPILELATIASAVSERHDYSLRGKIFGEGELSQLTTAFNDMLTRIEEQTGCLSASETRHRLLFENSPLPMWVYELATRKFLAVNGAASFAYGYTPAEFLAMTIDDIRPPEDLPALREDMARTPPRSIYHSPKVWRHTKKDGTVSLVEITSHDLNFDGKPSRLVLSNDITARVRAEEEIWRLNQELEQRVEQRTVQLEQANRELESFSYSVSHDLRAPLRHVQGYVVMLQRVMDGQLPEKAGRYLKTISEASIEMGQLIDDLLDFSRMGRTEMRETAVPLTALVRDCVQRIEASAAGREIAWEIAPLPVVVGDAAMLRQVWINLLSNAVKYSRGRTPARIEIGTVGEENGRVVCYVRDNGAGFDPQFAHKLFGVFQRLHHSDEFEGTGIGLATVRRIVSRHGGRIWAEGAVDQGATFYFTLRPAGPETPGQTNLP